LKVSSFSEEKEAKRLLSILCPGGGGLLHSIGKSSLVLSFKKERVFSASRRTPATKKFNTSRPHECRIGSLRTNASSKRRSAMEECIYNCAGT
jgi:hypothetical protein